MKKFRSFTIIELSISLLISGVVISIAYYSYLLLRQQYIKHQAKADLIQEYLLFHKAMQSDVQHSDFINDSANFISFKNLNLAVISQYNFQDSFVVRQHSEFTDTFPLKPASYQFFHLGNNSGLVNIIDIVFIAGSDHLGADFTKVYSAQQLLKNKRNYE